MCTARRSSWLWPQASSLRLRSETGAAIVQVGGRGSGAIVAFELTTGEERWRWEGPGPEYSSPVVLTVDGTQQVVAMTEKTIVDVGPCLLALSTSSELVAFAPDPEKFHQLAAIKLSETSTYAHPVASGKGIFVKDENHLTLWTVN